MSKIPMQERKYRITFLEKVLGTAPLNKEIYQDYIASRAPKVENGEEEVDMIQPDEKGMTGFHRDADGIYLLNYMAKGFLKEAANNLKEVVVPADIATKKKEKEAVGIKNLRSKIDNFVFIRPRHLWLKETHDGILERPIRVMTPKGPRVSLAASQYIDEGTTIELTIQLLPHKELDWDLIETLLDYGEYKGLGQWRNADFGSFTWEELPMNGKQAK